MDNVPPHSVPPLPTNPGAIHGFADALFRYADTDSWVSLRVSAQHGNAAAPMRIAAVRARDPATIAALAAEVAQWAAAHDRTTVFCGPIATFASNRGAAMKNMANGLAISVDVDNADPREALRVLSAIIALGPPMVIVHTGSVWMDPRSTSSCPSAATIGA